MAIFGNWEESNDCGNLSFNEVIVFRYKNSVFLLWKTKGEVKYLPKASIRRGLFKP